MVKQSRTADLEPIDRLEQKVKLLVALVERLRTEQARTADENQRVQSELDTLRGRIAQAEHADTEITALRAEREQVRTRVAGMLEQLESLDL